MKNCFHHSMPPPGGGYLLQRILACGKLHRRPECVFLCPDLLPRDAQPPFSVPDAAVCSTPQWHELPRRGCSGLTLLVNVPVALRLQDRCGRVFQAELPLEAELTLHERCPEKESWRGQVFIQSAVRPGTAAWPTRETTGRSPWSGWWKGCPLARYRAVPAAPIRARCIPGWIPLPCRKEISAAIPWIFLHAGRKKAPDLGTARRPCGRVLFPAGTSEKAARPASRWTVSPVGGIDGVINKRERAL